mmetsp:Transcript_17458/g.36162  ORF Transcript_17458/g.36162 Transcript_17458/m.36162 type:complete len:207 (-) Transcript_17458:34-654(-)
MPPRLRCHCSMGEHFSHFWRVIFPPFFLRHVVDSGIHRNHEITRHDSVNFAYCFWFPKGRPIVVIVLLFGCVLFFSLQRLQPFHHGIIAFGNFIKGNMTGLQRIQGYFGILLLGQLGIKLTHRTRKGGHGIFRAPYQMDRYGFSQKSVIFLVQFHGSLARVIGINLIQGFGRSGVLGGTIKGIDQFVVDPGGRIIGVLVQGGQGVA